MKAPTINDMIDLADQALNRMPPELSAFVRGVSIQVVDFADEETLRDLDMDNPFDLMGLYHGVPFGEADGMVVAHQPDMIFLYRRPILDHWCESGEDLDHIVAHVLIHEIGHHFGFSDEDMEAIEAAAG